MDKLPSLEVNVSAPSLPEAKLSVQPDELMSVDVSNAEIEPRTTAPANQPESVQALIRKQSVSKFSFPLLNKQVCRDQVEVTYKVTHPDGTKGIHKAKVQAQGRVLAMSADKQKFKLRATGWYSKNTNLHRWRPYLDKPPMAKGIRLAKDAEFWDKKASWYKCDLTPFG